MTYQKLFLIAVSLLSFGSLDARELSLAKAMDIALQQNIGLQQAVNNTQVSKNTASLANAGLLPRLDLSASSTYTDATNQLATGEVSQTSTRNSAGLNTSLSLFNGLQGYQTYHLLKTQASAAQLQEILVTENMLLAVGQTYFSFLMNYDNLRILKEQMDVSRGRLEQALDKNARGVSSSLQALSAQVDYDADSSAVLEAEYAYTEARRSLNLLLGWDIQEVYEPEGVNRPFGVYDPAQLETKAISSNTSYLLSQNQDQQADLNLKTTLGTVLPRVTLSANYGLTQVNPDLDLGLDNADLALSGGVNLSWNLFDGRKSKSLQSARILKKNAELSSLDSKRTLLKSLESAYGAYLKSMQVLDLKQTTLASAELNFEQTQEFFRLGQVGSTQFRESQVNLSRVKSSLSQARYNAYLNEMKLWQLTGDIQSKR